MFWTRNATKEDITTALGAIIDPDMISGLVMQDGNVLVTLDIDPARHVEMEQAAAKAKMTLERLKGIKQAQIILTAEKTPARADAPPIPKLPEQTREIAPQVKHIIAVASGKGGVGKSTVAVNLAIALQQTGLSVGLLDADVYGPSVPMLLGLRDKKPESRDDYLLPLEAHGLKIMSMGFMVKEETPMVWRGPMVQSALLQMLRDVRWGALDVLVIDMPPGTGDTQLTIAQRVKLAGAVIVSTPQDIALLDTVKGVQMFQKVSVPILGIIENMSYFSCPHCGENADIFGQHGARTRAAEMNVRFLGEIPLNIEVREKSDQGMPVALDPLHPVGRIFHGIALEIRETLLQGAGGQPAPLITIEPLVEA
ncbi:MAG: putative mrp protein [Alphaproteobacteria bacterium]|nr:putative mrp protein [Alphaproteobacteria bacterium]